MTEFGSNMSTILSEGEPMLPRDPLDPEAKMAEHTFNVCSLGVLCLLNGQPAHVELVGYNGMTNMMQY